MRTQSRIAIPSLLVASLAGCAITPIGPTARVLPAAGKPFEVFQADQIQCRQFAEGQVDGGSLVSRLEEFGTLAGGTVLSAGAGYAFGRTRGAEIGAALGALGGAGSAVGGAMADQRGLQSRYDLAYTQCMYARGNQVPMGSRTAAAAGPAPGQAGWRSPADPPIGPDPSRARAIIVR